MAKYIMRLDDACQKMDLEKWDRMERLLTKYNIRPLVGVIPNCKDPDMDKYDWDEPGFLERKNRWQKKGWELALHGYTHVFETNSGGINPVHQRSEFAGHPYDIQKEKIIKGLEQLRKWEIEPKVFIAPAHTFDETTLEVIKEYTDIKFVSDTVATDVYTKYDLTFVPQQTGRARKLPFKVVTFCYHPNIMDDEAFMVLEGFIKDNQASFIAFPLLPSDRKLNIKDKFFSKLYFLRK